jgi:hypothetical protein
VWELLLVAYCAVCVSEGALQGQNGKQGSLAAGKYKFMYTLIKQEHLITERKRRKLDLNVVCICRPYLNLLQLISTLFHVVDLRHVKDP